MQLPKSHGKITLKKGKKIVKICLRGIFEIAIAKDDYDCFSATTAHRGQHQSSPLRLLPNPMSIRSDRDAELNRTRISENWKARRRRRK